MTTAFRPVARLLAVVTLLDLTKPCDSLINGRVWVCPPQSERPASNLDEATAVANNKETSREPVSGLIHVDPNSKKLWEAYEDVERQELQELESLVCMTSDVLRPITSRQPSKIRDTNGLMKKSGINRAKHLMKSWSLRASKKNSRSPYVVEQILKRLIDEQAAGNKNVTITTSMYNSLLAAWCNSDVPGSVQRAEGILAEMERQGTEPDTGSYTALIKAYIRKKGDLEILSKAEQTIERMKSRGVQPSASSYNLLLYAISNSELTDAGTRAQNILEEMKKECAEGFEEMRPTINTYNQVICAWARTCEPGYVQRVDQLLDEICEAVPNKNGYRPYPNVDVFNNYLGCILKAEHPESLPKIEDALQRMLESYDSGNYKAKPNHVTLNIVMTAYIKFGGEGALDKASALLFLLSRDYGVHPDQASQCILVGGLKNSGHPDTPDRMIQLLDAIEDQFKKNKWNQSAKPKTFVYCDVIDSFTKSGLPNAPLMAERIVARMRDLSKNYGGEDVNTDVLNACMNAWASSKHPSRAKRVREILSAMEATDSAPKPNQITYNTVLKTMRCPGADLDYACEVLDKMEHLGLADSYSYSSVIMAFGRSEAPDKAPRALAILRRINNASTDARSAKVGNFAYNSCLNCCAHTKGNSEDRFRAFDVAQTVWDLLNEHSQPDEVSFGIMLGVLVYILSYKDPRRELLAEELWTEACRQGRVGTLVVKNMKRLVSLSRYRELTGVGANNQFRRLPQKWTRYAKN